MKPIHNHNHKRDYLQTHNGVRETSKETINIELDITLRCNGKCINCVRHCNMQDLGVNMSDMDMTLEQIEQFSELVIKNGNVSRVRIMGGEPLLHPQIEKITDYLKKNLLDKKYIRTLKIISNLLIKREQISNIEITNFNAYETKHKHHRCTLVAPIDTGQKITYPCNFPIMCGFGYNAKGCFPCGAGSAICGLFKLDQYCFKTIPNSLEEFGDLYDLCKLCQVAASGQFYERDYGRKISASYQKRFDELLSKK